MRAPGMPVRAGTQCPARLCRWRHRRGGLHCRGLVGGGAFSLQRQARQASRRSAPTLWGSGWEAPRCSYDWPPRAVPRRGLVIPLSVQCPSTAFSSPFPPANLSP